MKTLIKTNEYFKLNAQGELEVCFSGIKKELTATKRKSSLQNKLVSQTNNNIYDANNSKKIDSCQQVKKEKLQLIDGGVGVGKTTLMLKETIKTMLAGGVVIYGTHSIDAQVERSIELQEEIQKYINAGVNKLKVAHCEKAAEKVEKLKALLNRVKMVSSKDLDKGVTVDSMFQNVMCELKLQPNTGACVLVTNVAVRLINFDALSNNNDLLVLDDDVTPFSMYKPFDKHNLNEVEIVKACFKTEVVRVDDNESTLKINGKADQFGELIKDIERKNSTNTKFTAEIKKVAHMIDKEKNNDLFLKILKNKQGSYNVEQFSKLSQNVFEHFKTVYALSENVKNDNTAVYSWLKEGVKYDYTMLTYDSEKRGKKFLYGADGKPMIRIASIAGENKFTIAKATNDQQGYVKVTDYINNLGSIVEGVMFSKNNRVHETAFNNLKCDFDTVSTITRSRNDLMHNNVMLNYGLNKVDNYTGSSLNSLHGVSMDELDQQVTISAQVQNIGRGALRTTQTKPVVLIFPDNETARASMIRYAKSYPELQPFMDELLSNIEVINDEQFKNEKKVYENEKTRRRVNYLKSVHGEKTVQSFIEQHGAYTAIEYFDNLSVNEKELKKQVTKIAQKAKDYKVKSTEVKQAAEKIGLNEFIEKCENLKGKAIAELVMNINNNDETIAGGVVEVVETVQETVSTTVEKRESTFANFKAKMKQNKNIDEFKNNIGGGLELPSIEHGKDNQELKSVDFMDSVDNSKTAFNFGDQLKSTAFTMSSMY
ncbi:hypothetical protein [Pseudoalteromonas sp. BSi20495]|uniref:hypothetical protein n=1 Tax=Pseudoalteromonas sp. BSi20495 TaxID=386429 RepID=UPI00023159C2|nr:hypothetical protein [Pseudoalteromonas sp. BSi20495]GAA78193.1 hypothetical protein P20495_0684 [Pseudoalteromonas sp. BSi20495]